MESDSIFKKIIGFSKAIIMLSVAIFFVRCSVGDLGPDVHFNGMEDGDEFRIEVIEGNDREVIIIRKNGGDLEVINEIPPEKLI